MMPEYRERRWRLRIRMGSDNLFARLSPSLAQALLNEARETSKNRKEGPGWQAQDAPLFDADSDSGVAFLPLEISLPDASKIYTSYNGGSISDDDAIELPHHFIPSKFTGRMVELHILPFVPDIHHLKVEPISSEDWELMELYSGFLENGSLLNQVSVVYPGQLLKLNVGPNNVVTLRVDPELTRYGRLSADTEVVVVPKPRKRTPTPSQPLRLVGTADDWSDSMRRLAALSGIPLLHVSPGSVLVHPNTLETKIPGWIVGQSPCQHAIVWKVNDTGGGGDEGTVTIVRIVPSKSIVEGVIALHVFNRYTIDASLFVDSVFLQLLTSEFIEKVRRTTSGQILYEKVDMRIQTLEAAWDEEAPWKPWRHPDNPVQSEFDSSSFTTVDHMPRELLLTTESVFYSHRTNSLCRLALRASGNINCNKAFNERLPSVIVTYEEACLASLAGSLIWAPPSWDRSLRAMPPTLHCLRPMDSEWLESFLLQRDLVDAWMFHGDTGAGKTHHTQVLASIANMRWGMPTFYLDCTKLQAASELRMNTMLQELTFVCRQAMKTQPSILILDDLDFLVSNEELGGSAGQRLRNSTMTDQSKLLTNHLQALIEASVSEVLLLITARPMTSLPTEITDALICRTSITIEPLSQMERATLASLFLKGFPSNLLDMVSTLSEGYRAKDLRIVATRINVKATYADDMKKNIQDVMDEYVPLSRQGLALEKSCENQTWNDVGGIFDAKEKLKTTILNPIKYRRIYEKAPIKLPKGIMLFGPPGCGKSYLVPALAKECSHTLITCRGPELLDRYIGASEANVRKLFERARSAAPAILFLDEFDALAPRRGSDNTGVTDRVVNQLLTYLDGVETTVENVFLIVATSRPDKIDPALLRPGRLEQHIYVGFPASSEEFMDVMLTMMAQRQSSESLLQSLREGTFVLNNEEYSHLAHLSPADIKAVLDTAHLEAIHEHLASTRTEPVVIQDHHFHKALMATRASLSLEDRERFTQLFRPFLRSSHKSYSKEPNHDQLKTSLR